MKKEVLSLDLLDLHISECREYVEAGKEVLSTLDFLLKLRENLATVEEADWAAYNELTDHLIDKSDNSVLFILKGQLLIERLVRKFIVSRLPNPKAFENQNFNASQCISIAESMCLNNEEPRWLWTQVKELNSIRNKLAHSLDDKTFEKRINNFVSTVSNAQKITNKSISNVIAHLYGMVKALCDLSNSNEFKLF
jgi:hypothetical protein